MFIFMVTIMPFRCTFNDMCKALALYEMCSIKNIDWLTERASSGFGPPADGVSSHTTPHPQIMHGTGQGGLRWVEAGAPRCVSNHSSPKANTDWESESLFRTECGSHVHLPIVQCAVDLWLPTFSSDSTCKIGLHSVRKYSWQANGIGVIYLPDQSTWDHKHQPAKSFLQRRGNDWFTDSGCVYNPGPSAKADFNTHILLHGLFSQSIYEFA